MSLNSPSSNQQHAGSFRQFAQHADRRWTAIASSTAAPTSPNVPGSGTSEPVPDELDPPDELEPPEELEPLELEPPEELDPLDELEPPEELDPPVELDPPDELIPPDELAPPPELEEELVQQVLHKLVRKDQELIELLTL